jgi:hypothetical protein
MKVCGKCKEEKELSEFHRDRDKKDNCSTQCKNCRNIKKREYRKNNKKKINSQAKIYRDINRLEINKWRRDNRDSIRVNERETRRKYKKERMSSNPIYRLGETTSNLIRCSIRNSGFTKKSRAHETLGCDYKTFMSHLNNNPYGFKYGDENLDLDHIIPTSTAKTEEEVLKLNHFTNLQLLPSDYNRHIKKDNPWDQAHFEEWWAQNKKAPPENSDEA